MRTQSKCNDCCTLFLSLVPIARWPANYDVSNMLISHSASALPQGTRQRSLSLDVLRGVAVALVLLCHFPYFYYLGRLGGAGVTLFFVLSGYLISGLLFQEYQQTGTIRIGRFLMRRGLKIWPSAYVYLGVVTVFMLQVRGPRPWRSLALSAAFLTNYCSENCAGIVGHTWSLAVEEHFYLALPFILLLLMRTKKLHWIPGLCIFLIVACCSLRYFDHGAGAYEKTHCRIDSLFLGVTLGYLRHVRSSWFSRIASPWNLIPAACFVTTWTSPSYPFNATIALFLVPAGFAIIVAWAVEHEGAAQANRIWLKPLARLGAYSYSIYLWQQAFASVIHGTRPTFWEFAFLSTGSIMIGIVMAKCVEIPVLRLRDRVLPSTGGSAATEHAPRTIKQLRESLELT